MSRQMHRIGDSNTGGGRITVTPQSTVFANNRLVAVNGSVGTSHPPCPKPAIHCAGAWRTTGGSPNVFINNIPVNRIGDPDTCGHSRAAGSENVYVN